MDNMEELWDKLHLTDEEAINIKITEDEVEIARRKRNLCLLGKLWINRVINKGVVEAYMGKI